MSGYMFRVWYIDLEGGLTKLGADFTYDELIGISDFTPHEKALIRDCKPFDRVTIGNIMVSKVY